MCLFDLSDLMQWYLSNTRVTGIQRITEIFAANIARGEPEACFVFRPRWGQSLIRLDSAVVANIDGANGTPARQAALAQLAAMSRAARTAAAFRSWWRNTLITPGACLYRLVTYPIRKRPWSKSLDLLWSRKFQKKTPIEHQKIVILGCFWGTRNDVEFYQNLQRKISIKIIPLIYDVISISHPEFFSQNHVDNFSSAFFGILDLTNQLVIMSDAVQADIQAVTQGKAPARLRFIKIRTGFGLPQEINPVSAPTVETILGKRAVPSKPYVLCVGTLEPRKNPGLLLEAWSRLGTRHGDALPLLIFAGKRGWMIDDVLSRLSSDQTLQGRVYHITDANDDELTTLYRNALLCVYPSFAEGWGLPVEEAVAFGKLCIASNAPSHYEAGHGLAVLFNPNDLDDFIIKITPYLFDREALRQEEERITAHAAEIARKTSWPAVTVEFLSKLKALPD